MAEKTFGELLADSLKTGKPMSDDEARAAIRRQLPSATSFKVGDRELLDGAEEPSR